MGTKGLVWSASSMGVLLHEGIGDTIRVSLTPRPGGDRRDEVYAACELLQALGLGHGGAQVRRDAQRLGGANQLLAALDFRGARCYQALVDLAHHGVEALAQYTFVAKARARRGMPVLYHLVALDLDGRIIGAFPVDGRDKGLPLRAERLLCRARLRAPGRFLGALRGDRLVGFHERSIEALPIAQRRRSLGTQPLPLLAQCGHRAGQVVDVVVSGKKLFGGRDQVLAFLLCAPLGQVAA